MHLARCLPYSSGLIAWVIWLAVHIFFLIGFRNRVLVMFQWAWAYLTYQPGARLITPQEPRSAEPEVLTEELAR